MIDIFTILKWISILFLLWLLMIIYNIAIKPYMRCQYYVKQGGLFTIFMPGVGAFGRQAKEVEQFGDFYHTVKTLSQDHKKTPRFIVDNIGVKAQVSLIEPKLINDFYKKQDLYEKTKMFDSVKILFKEGIITCEREAWKRQRKMASSAFHFESIKNMMPKFQEIAKLHFDKIKVGDKVDILELFQQIAGEVIGVMFFGYDTNSKTIWGKPLTIALTELSNELYVAIKHPGTMLFGKTFFTSGLSKFHSQCLKKFEEYRSLIRGIIEEKRKNLGNDDDFLTRMLKTQELENENERFTTEEILDQFLAFFLAGMDTTSHLVDIALYLSHAHPDMAKKLDEERQKHFDKFEVVNLEEVQKMDYLDCFLKECLRQYNPIPHLWSREALEDHVLGDIKIRKGDLVKADLFSNFFNAEYFENPWQFRPERWAEPKIKNLDPFVFIPFSSGPRNCIGQHMAMLEAKTIFSQFRRTFDFTVDPDYKLKMIWRLSYEPFDPVMAQITKIKA